MIYFLTTQPLWLSSTILVGLTSLLAAFGPLIVRRYVSLEKLTAHNEIAGFKFATVGVLYAVLLAFAIFMVWQKYSDAEAAVAQEAGAAETIYRLLYGIGDQTGATLREKVVTYLAVTITDDWPAMDRGAAGAHQKARQSLSAIYAALLTFQSPGQGASPFMSEILHQLDVMTQARRSRLVAAEGTVPGVVWSVLFGGAVVTVVFTFFFGTRNLRAQVMMTVLLSILVFSELLIIVAIDRPFSGTVKVEPDALERVLADFKSELGSSPNSPEQPR